MACSSGDGLTLPTTLCGVRGAIGIRTRSFALQLETGGKLDHQYSGGAIVEVLPYSAAKDTRTPFPMDGPRSLWVVKSTWRSWGGDCKPRLTLLVPEVVGEQ